ncbi:hypothetical protein [Rhodococcus koreensis]
MLITAIHGIGQQQSGPESLLSEWKPAIADGIGFAGGNRKGTVPIDLAFYGHLFMPKVDNRRKTKGSSINEELDGLTDDEVDALVDAAGEILTDEEIASAAIASTKGMLKRAPGQVPEILSALDRKFGTSAGVLYFGQLRQVRRYLTDPAMKSDVDTAVCEAIPEDCRILIGHSLGSVVAFEFVRQNPDHQLDLLLTLGSPLGLRMVRSRMPDPTYGLVTPSGVPPNLRTWTNLWDPHDAVACAGSLAKHWPGVFDIAVNNEKDAHSAVRYLRKKVAGSALLAAGLKLGVDRA